MYELRRGETLGGWQEFLTKAIADKDWEIRRAHKDFYTERWELWRAEDTWNLIDLTWSNREFRVDRAGSVQLIVREPMPIARAVEAAIRARTGIIIA